jgi:membrane protease YdiL (CAAX protease family)
MVLSFFLVRPGGLSFDFVAVSTMVRDLALVSLILYFLWRNGETRESLGWTFKNRQVDLVLGLGLFLPFLVGANFLDRALQGMGFSAPATPLPALFQVEGPAEVLLALVLVAVVAWAEETIFRGYLMLRFQGLNLTPIARAVLSSAIFALGHGYEGSSGVATVAAMGLAFALVYLWRGSLVAPMVMHFLMDFSGIVLPALVGMK